MKLITDPIIRKNHFIRGRLSVRNKYLLPKMC